jgi:hypothetical protein
LMVVIFCGATTSKQDLWVSMKDLIDTVLWKNFIVHSIFSV